MIFSRLKKILSSLFLFLICGLPNLEALNPVHVEFLSHYRSSEESFIETKEAFESVALMGNIPLNEVVAELQKIDPDYATEVVKDEDYWKLSFLLDNGWNISRPNSEGHDLLVVALKQGHFPVVELVLKFGGWKIAANKVNSKILEEADLAADDWYAALLEKWENPTKASLEKPTSASFRVDGKSRNERSDLRELAPMSPGGLARRSTPLPKFSRVEVPFATNRDTVEKYKNQLHSPEGAEAYFSFTGDSQSMSYGVAEVSIPRIHQKGRLESRGLLEFKYDSAKHVVLQKLSLTDSESFFSDLGERMKKREEKFDGVPQSKDLFVYIHGFNVDFSYAMRKTAQIMYDMDYPGLSIAFSWPAKIVSVPLPMDFKADVTRAENSIFMLENFLLEILKKYPERRVHIVAHSLGTRVLSSVLVNISKSMNVDLVTEGAKKLFGEVILAAPAIDAETFVKNWAAQIAPLCERVSVYGSDDDFALKVQFLAENKHFSFPLGLWDEKAGKRALADGVSNFDLSSLSAGTFSLDHSVYSEVPIAIDHMRLLIHDSGKDPDFLGSGYLNLLNAEDSISGAARQFWKFLEF